MMNPARKICGPGLTDELQKKLAEIVDKADVYTIVELEVYTASTSNQQNCSPQQADLLVRKRSLIVKGKMKRRTRKVRSKNKDDEVKNSYQSLTCIRNLHWNQQI